MLIDFFFIVQNCLLNLLTCLNNIGLNRKYSQPSSLKLYFSQIIESFNNFMRSSLPEIYRKHSSSLYKPQKQAGQFSLFLRTNNFQQQTSHDLQKRYQITERHRLNKSMDVVLEEARNINLPEESEAKLLKSLLSKRQKSRPRSFFILQNQDQTGQEVDSFNNIFRRIFQELSLLEKVMQMSQKSQIKIRNDMQNFKKNHVEDLGEFQTEMRKSLSQLRSVMKTLKKKAITQIKINKEQATFLQEEMTTLKQIYTGFNSKQHSFRLDLVSETSPEKG